MSGIDVETVRERPKGRRGGREGDWWKAVTGILGHFKDQEEEN